PHERPASHAHRRASRLPARGGFRGGGGRPAGVPHLWAPRSREEVHWLGNGGPVKTPREEFVHVFVGHDLAPGWFGWIIPTGDGGVRAGIGSSNAVKPIACYRRLTQLFPRLFDGIESCRLYGGTIPLDFAPRSYADNVLLVGD